jgi:tetratricopeptide (TPR) repeat protein
MRRAVLLLCLWPAVAWAGDDPAWVIPPGQDEIVGEIVGVGETSVGDCEVDGAAVEPAKIVARYSCAGTAVTVELVHPSTVPDAPRVHDLAVRAPEGAPASLVAAVRARIDEHAAGFRWVRPSDGAREHRTFEPATAAAADDLSAAERTAYDRGLVLYRQRQYTDALEVFTELARTQPRHGVLGMVVASLASTHPTAERVGELARAADDTPDDALAQFTAGVAAHYYAHQSGRDRTEKDRYYTSALQYLERVRAKYEFEPRLYIYLAVSHFRLGHQDQAEQLIERAVALDTGDPDAYYCRAEIFQRVDTARSIADLERYLRMVADLRAAGVVDSAGKTQRVRAMLDHLRAVQRGDAPAGELFDPYAADDDSRGDLRASSPAVFAGGIAAVAVLVGLGWWLAARRRRRATSERA